MVARWLIKHRPSKPRVTGSNPVGRTIFITIYIVMKVGDLVALNEQSHFVDGIQDILGVPFSEIGIVIAARCDVCCVVFPLIEDKVRSFMQEDLKIISEVKDERE